MNDPAQALAHNTAEPDILDWVLDAVIEGNYSLHIEATDRLAKKLDEALRVVRERASRQLGDVVDSSMAVCDAAVQAAYLMRDFQSVGAQSGQLAEATGRMSSATEEIGQYGKAIAA